MQNVEKLAKQLERVENTYKPLPFWSWNGKLEKEELLRQIRWMEQTNNGGFFMHARSGLKTQYLSEEWMACIQACAEGAGELQAWLYDENGWPSGFAGGKLLEREEDRDQYLSHQLGEFDPNATVSYYLENGKLIRTQSPVPGREHLNVSVHTAVSTADILNPEVTEKFLALTHQVYKEHFGENFSKIFRGFFTDEPQYQRWHTPYTPVVADYFREHYGQDIFDGIGLLFVEAEDFRTFRYRYWKAMQQLMLDNFAKKVYHWCEENDVQLTGHYVEEISMGCQIMCCAGVMPFYEYEHIPGIDWLGKFTDNELSPRQVGSAACQLGKKQVITESFGCCGHEVTPQDLRRIVGFQYVNGANLLCQHLIPYAENGNRKRDHPAHYSPKNSWVKEDFGAFNLYVSRLSKLLSGSTEQVKVAVLHPIRGSYFDYKREEADFAIGQLDTLLRQDCRRLSENGINYHFLDETLLEKHSSVGQQWFNGTPVEMQPVGRLEEHTWRANPAPLLHTGINDYTVRVNWHQDEQVYFALFGENVTESLRNCIVYDSELEPVYLRGKFGVYSHQLFGDDGIYTFGGDFYIGRAPTTVTEPVCQGFPFFRGTLTVRQRVHFPEGTTHLRVPGTFQCATVYINDRMAGKLLLNRTVEIEKYLHPGENDVRIDYVISNRNLLGPHHWVDASSRYGVSPTCGRSPMPGSKTKKPATAQPMSY